MGRCADPYYVDFSGYQPMGLHSRGSHETIIAIYGKKIIFWPGALFWKAKSWTKLAWTGPFGLFGPENGTPKRAGAIRTGFGTSNHSRTTFWPFLFLGQILGPLRGHRPYNPYPSALKRMVGESRSLVRPDEKRHAKPLV